MNIKEKCAQKTKYFQDVTTKRTTDKQTNNYPTILFDTEYFPFEKKTGPGQIRTQDLCRPRHIRYLQAKLFGKTAQTFVRTRPKNSSIK